MDQTDRPIANPIVVLREEFDELGPLGVMNVILAGGEPFIREDLPVLLDSIVRNRMRFSILSDGTLINDEIAAFIADTRRCENVQVSVDGSCAKDSKL